MRLGRRAYKLYNRAPFRAVTVYVDKDQHIWTQIVGHTPCRENIFGLKVGVKTEVPINEADLILCDNLPKQYIIEWLNDDGTLYSREVVDSFFTF